MKKKLIERVTVGSGGAASITFSDIPAGYSDLYLVFSLMTTAASGNALIKINGSTANCSVRSLFGSGSGVESETTYRLVAGINDVANTPASGAMYIPNYASTTAAKSWSIDTVNEGNITTRYQTIQAGLFNSTTAITAIDLSDQGGGTIREFSSASLYGIVRGSDGTTTVS